MAKFCKKCGTLMSDDEKFCPKCGASGKSRTPNTPSERKAIVKGKLISLGVAAIVIVLGLVYFYLLRR